MGSAHLNQTNYLAKEIKLGCMLGPFEDSVALNHMHFNYFGVIAEGHQTGKWWLITDLSYMCTHRAAVLRRY